MVFILTHWAGEGQLQLEPFFKKEILEDIPPFCGPLISLFWTSGDICSGFQNQSGSSTLRASLLLCNRFPRFTSGATPADLLAASMAVKPF